MPMMERTALALTLMSALALPIAHANAQSWQRAVRVIVPLPPGIPNRLGLSPIREPARGEMATADGGGESSRLRRDPRGRRLRQRA
jgi:hypothetical protein